MSTVRFETRRVQPPRAFAGVDRRGLMVVAALCIASFGCAFALGRVSSPGGSPRELAPPTVPVVSARNAIPTRLSGAPAIGLQPNSTAVARAFASSSAVSRAAAGRSPFAGGSGAEGLGGREALAAPAEPRSPPRFGPGGPEEAPSPGAGSPAAGGGSSGGEARRSPRPRAGKSFDTSG
jgi:hypothetical protein